MKKNHSKKHSDSLLYAFKGETLLDKGQLTNISGGQGDRTKYTVTTNDAHTQGDVGNCDTDTRERLDVGSNVYNPTFPTLD